MIRRRQLNVAMAGLLALGMGAGIAPAAFAGTYDSGASDTEIKIGNTIGYSGPAAYYGGYGLAIGAYFDKLNKEKGGINGRKINWISLDDGYVPAKAVENVRSLVEKDGVLLTLFTNGTPINAAIRPYLNSVEVPQIFLGSPASKFGDPANFPWSIGFAPTYETEGYAYAKYILEHIPDAKIGILYQNDDFGKDYIKGLHKAFGDDYDKHVVMAVSYEPTDPTVDSQIIALQGAGVNAFIDVAQQKFAAQAIRKMSELGWKPAHFLTNIAASISGVFEPAGIEASKGIISAVWIKDPADPAWADDQGLKDYLEFMKTYLPGKNPNEFLYVYGYSIAQAFEKLIEQCGDDLTRANVMKQVANLHEIQLPMVLPGITVNTSPTDFYPVQDMQLVKFDGERMVRFGDVIRGGN